jgi:hypothetical protein
MTTSRRIGSHRQTPRPQSQWRSLIARLTALITALGVGMMSTANAWAQLSFDVAAPVISHSVAESAGLAGSSQTITATVTDNDQVQSVTLFHRSDSNHVFSQTTMSAGVQNTWLATIDTGTGDSRIEYYLTATDVQGNRVQKGTADNPLVLPLLVPESTLATSEPTPSVTVPPTPEIRDSDLAGAATQRPNWLLIGLGVLALGVLAGASGGGGSSSSTPSCCAVTFTAPNASTN